MATRSNTPRKVAVLAIATTALAGCSIPLHAHRTTGRAQQVTTTTLYTSPQRPVGPTRTVDGVPAVFRHDAAGARAAAVAYVTTYPPLVTAEFITRDDAVRQMASTGYAPTLAGRIDRGAGELSDEVEKDGLTPADATVTETPLTATVTATSPDRVRVSLWCVGVVSFAQAPAAFQSWQRTDLALVWERGDWRIDGWTTHDGPTPKIGTNDQSSSSPEVAAVQHWPAATAAMTGTVS
jgi:hypothetical protein